MELSRLFEQTVAELRYLFKEFDEDSYPRGCDTALCSSGKRCMTAIVYKSIYERARMGDTIELKEEIFQNNCTSPGAVKYRFLCRQIGERLGKL